MDLESEGVLLCSESERGDQLHSFSTPFFSYMRNTAFFMTHIIQSMKRSYLFEEIVQTMRRYISVNMHTAHYFRNSFHFDQREGDNLTPDKNHKVKVSPKTLLKFVYINVNMKNRTMRLKVAELQQKL